MATSKLSVYNGSLRELGDTRIATLTEACTPRYILDDVYDSSVKACLEAGQWKFAMRSQELSASTTVDPAFGFGYAFEKPSDWVRTSSLSSDERFSMPLLDYADENGFFYADFNTLYIRMVSDDPAFGMDLSLWPESFARFVEVYIARRICLSISNSATTTELLDRALRKVKMEALSKDAMNEGTKFPRPGSWVLSRGGGRNSSRWDRSWS